MTPFRQTRLKAVCHALGMPVLLALFLLACGGPALTAEEVATRAGQAMAQVNSLHFSLSVEGGPAHIDPESSLSMRGAEGDLVRPDRVQATVRVGVRGLVVVTIQAVGIGTEQFITRPVTGEWQRMPTGWGFDPTILFDREQGIEQAVTRVDWQAEPAEEYVGETRCHFLQGTAAGPEIAPLTAWMITAEEVTVDLWVDQQDDRVRRLRIVEPPTAEAENGTIWTLEFSAFDQEVTIERPPGF